MGVANQFVGFGFVFGTYGIGSVFVNGLRHESQMSHHRDTGAYDTFHRVDDFFTAFELQCVSVTFFHDADSGSKALHLIALVRSERHINYHHRTLYTTYYGFGMINHLVERDR